MKNQRVYIGVDVAKASLEISSNFSGKSAWKNERKDIVSLLQHMERDYQSVLLCCEATGGYEKLLIETCMARNVPVVLMNPKRIRDFARSKGILAKTDKIDANIIAMFAQQNDVQPMQISQEWRHQLKDLDNRREMLVDMRAGEKNRMDPKPSQAICRSIQRTINFLEKDIGKIKTQI